MKFKINNHNWEIIEISNEKIQKLYEDVTGIKDNFAYGVTCYSTQVIFINEEINKECILFALKHELAHCYLWSYGFREVDYGEEIVCDVIANSNDFINEIVNKYKKLKEGDKKMACGRKRKGGTRK